MFLVAALSAIAALVCGAMYFTGVVGPLIDLLFIVSVSVFLVTATIAIARCMRRDTERYSDN